MHWNLPWTSLGLPAGAASKPEYAYGMNSQLEPHRSKPPIVRRAVAGLVVVVVAALAIHIVIGLVLTVFWIVVAVAAVAAILWALKTIVW